MGNHNDDSKLKDAMERDLEQTKADLTGDRKGQDLDQDVDNTLRQASGKENIPPDNVPNRD